MTQQVDSRNPSSTETSQSVPLSAYVFGGPSGSNPFPTNANGERWAFIVNAREAVSTFIQDTASSTKPQREKLNVYAQSIWQQYLTYLHEYPLLTIFTTSLVMLSAGPILVFGCITGVSLGILIGVASVIIFVIQSIIFGIAGAILLFVLGAILVLTVILFAMAVAGYTGFKIVRDIAVVVHTHHQQLVEKQNQKQNEQDNAEKIASISSEI
ncbi:hypothetical protein BGZ76_007313 [Entomortierella beljakovae]|nr:hypothetical protein BGZ76_007313 [Entomortierella beljakovae]